jgi:hypothetical protein
VNARTFVGLQYYAKSPGARIEYRTNRGWRYSAFLQPRVILGTPTLAEQKSSPVVSGGAFIIREWRF